MIKIENEPFTDQQIDDDIKKIDFIYHLHYSKLKWIKNWINNHHIEKSHEEEIVYIHRYKSTNDCTIGIKRLKELEYFT